MENNQEEKNVIETSQEEAHTNTMEQAEEKNSKKRSIIIILLLSVLLLVVLVVFLIGKDKKEQNNPNTLDPVTKSDDITQNDDNHTNNIQKVGNTLNIYSAGYADMAPIAFTYECQSEECDLVTSTKGVIVYDNNVVKYRDFTQYEYEQIYGEDVTPIGENLDVEGFEEKIATKILNSDENGSVRLEVYNIGDVTFFLKVNLEGKKLYTKDSFCKQDNGDICSDYNVITYKNLLYNFNTNEVIYELEEDELFTSIGKNGEFIEIGYYSEVYNYGVVLNKNLDFIIDGDNYYINEDKIYYVENNKIINKNSNNETLEYDNNDIYVISLNEEVVLYTDSLNNIKLKNLKDNTVFYDSDIVVDPTSVELFFQSDDGNYNIIYKDDALWDNEAWIKAAIEQNDDESEDYIRNCAKDKCSEMLAGYEIIISSDGNFISKNYAGYVLVE